MNSYRIFVNTHIVNDGLFLIAEEHRENWGCACVEDRFTFFYINGGRKQDFKGEWHFKIVMLDLMLC